MYIYVIVYDFKLKAGQTSLKHFLQILQNIEFTYMQNSYCNHINFDSINQP
jgi:hypothetical protein